MILQEVAALTSDLQILGLDADIRELGEFGWKMVIDGDVLRIRNDVF